MVSGTKQWLENRHKKKAPSMKEMDRAYNAALPTDKGPKFTMRAKEGVEFGAQIKKKMCECPTSAGPIDIGKAKPEPPKWTMRARTCKMLQLPGQTTDAIPGPGKYPVPSTTYFNHPCLPMPGRVSMGSAPRFPSSADPDD